MKQIGFSINEVSLDVDGDGQIDVYAFDANADGTYDSFDVVLPARSIGLDPGPIIGIGPDPIVSIGPSPLDVVSFYDTDGDNIVDSYDDVDGNLTTLPTNLDGSINWAAIDNNLDGEPDIAKIDLDGDGNPDWDNPDIDGDGNADWVVETFDEFTNDGGFVTRTIDPVSGQFVFQIENGPDVLLARDTDNDGIPDQFAFDQDRDGEPDAPTLPFVVDTFRLLVPSGSNSLTVTSFNWDELTDRIIQRDEADPDAPITINLEDTRPQASGEDDILRVRSGETVDGLAGDDILLLPSSRAVVQFGEGSGNDLVIADASDNSGLSNTLELKGVNSLGEIEVLESSDGQDMIIRLLSTGESIRIERQINFDGFVPLSTRSFLRTAALLLGK